MFTITVLLTLLLLDLVVFSEMDCYGWSAIVFFGWVFSIILFIDPASAYVAQHGGIIHYVIDNAVWYLLFGIAVAAGKWILFNLKVASTLKDLRETFTKSDSADKYWEFVNYVENLSSSVFKGQPISPPGRYAHTDPLTEEKMVSLLTPSAKFHSGRIGAWVLQWPIVILDVVLMDVLMKIGKWVSRVFGTVFASMSKYLITNATKGL